MTGAVLLACPATVGTALSRGKEPESTTQPRQIKNKISATSQAASACEKMKIQACSLRLQKGRSPVRRKAFKPGRQRLAVRGVAREGRHVVEPAAPAPRN